MNQRGWLYFYFFHRNIDTRESMTQAEISITPQEPIMLYPHFCSWISNQVSILKLLKFSIRLVENHRELQNDPLKMLSWVWENINQWKIEITNQILEDVIFNQSNIKFHHNYGTVLKKVLCDVIIFFFFLRG